MVELVILSCSLLGLSGLICGLVLGLIRQFGGRRSATSEATAADDRSDPAESDPAESDLDSADREPDSAEAEPESVGAEPESAGAEQDSPAGAEQDSQADAGPETASAAHGELDDENAPTVQIADRSPEHKTADAD